MTKCYAAKHRNGVLSPFNVAYYARDARRSICEDLRMTWTELKKHGWSIVKCEIVEINDISKSKKGRK